MGTLSDEQRQALVAGIELEDGPAKVDRIEDGGGEGSNHWYRMVLKEGRNREVRRLIEALGLTVSRLIRTRYGSVAMPSRVKRGQTLELTGDEVAGVLVAAGMKSGASGPKPGGRPPQGKGPRPQRHGSHDRGSRDPRGDQPPRPPRVEAEATPNDGAGDEHRIEPGNSAHGAPTHGNTPVGKFFGKGHGRPHGFAHGQGTPRHAEHGHRAKGQGQNAQGGRGHGPQQGRGHGKPWQGATGPHRSPSSPYVMTTLTVPGAVPEGLPGTSGPRPNGPGAGNGPRVPGGPPGKKRGRGNRRPGPKAATTPNSELPPPAIPDDDIGNR